MKHLFLLATILDDEIQDPKLPLVTRDGPKVTVEFNASDVRHSKTALPTDPYRAPALGDFAEGVLQGAAERIYENTAGAPVVVANLSWMPSVGDTLWGKDGKAARDANGKYLEVTQEMYDAWMEGLRR